MSGCFGIRHINKSDGKFKKFDEDKYILIISTTSGDNNSLTNYVLFVKIGTEYFVSVSQNPPHYENIVKTKKAHILIIEDESSADHIYARKRVYFSASCEIKVDTEKVYRLFDEGYGEQLSFLRSMKDFKVIKITPEEKSLVLGFGAIYKMDVATL